ncbi:MAG: hypothetical protein M3461_08980, partial [Pseudomonadota bacterium]|nr:hypothetical protein [Pseudomonadota bacterium]
AARSRQRPARRSTIARRRALLHRYYESSKPPLSVVTWFPNRDRVLEASSIPYPLQIPRILRDQRYAKWEMHPIPKSALEEAQVIDSELIRALPSSSEGLAISGKTAYVVVDGDAGKDGVCKEPARYEIVSLP